MLAHKILEIKHGKILRNWKLLCIAINDVILPFLIEHNERVLNSQKFKPERRGIFILIITSYFLHKKISFFYHHEF